ncbi:zonular occludens toxin domain-containing protein [Paracidovorax valerianellae]|uniref:zonular occludens toxin domain-containing protein n=1 Tax=Paracidovorax valerianellae TaxID=187868 RepID=UPI0023021075|nr:zonular occludens toxin domain-containing protein [Paracidovorax valerianellae]MDA8445302.1 zonular occludens toxin domain-containing protein [Paracidovorax valerianellae]
MLHLITGANGAGKTLNTLKWVRERSVKEGRPVCHNGRFEAVEGGELSSWKTIDIKDWQAEPDGTIFVVDECHNDFPTRAAGATPPEHERMLAEHRRRGMDFYLVTQHPQNISSFVRRLVGNPGWHRHLKRTFGAELVSVLQWDAVNPNCEKDGSGKSATVTMTPFPKEVYGWYKSASLHTGKAKIPRAVWVMLACAILVPTMGYYAITGVYGNVAKTAKQAVPGAAADGAVGPGQGAAPNKVLTTMEYLEQRKPRLPDFAHTAPAYDQVTQPAIAPYPAACVQMGDKCRCYSQQATLMQVSAAVCAQIVRQGYFVDWAQPQQQNQQGQQMIQPQPRQAELVAQQQPLQQVRTVPVPVPAEPQPGLITPEQLSSALGVRNPAYAGLPRVSTR